MLEIGAGTGYFTLNLLRQGIVEEATAIDISPGMLDVLQATAAERSGCEVETEPADAERCRSRTSRSTSCSATRCSTTCPTSRPRSREFARVLQPGGHARVHGRAVAPRRPDRGPAEARRDAGRAGLAPAGRRAGRRNGVRPPPGPDRRRAARGSRRRPHLHARTSSGELALGRGTRRSPRSAARSCVANAYGWILRTLESRVEPESVPLGWHRFAYRSYLALQRLDGRLLEPRLPAEPLLQPAALGPQTGLARPGVHWRAWRLPPLSDFPLFPLPIVLLPSEVVPLHIFEERYKAMIAECLDEQREFGIVWLADDGLKEIGCTRPDRGGARARARRADEHPRARGATRSGCSSARRTSSIRRGRSSCSRTASDVDDARSATRRASATRTCSSRSPTSARTPARSPR